MHLRSPSLRPLGIVPIAVVALGYAVAFMTVSRVYLLDLPAWLYQGALVQALLRGESLPVALKPYPVPNTATSLLFAGAVPLLGAAWAGKVFAAVYVLASAAVSLLLARETDGDSVAPRALVIFSTLFVSSSFWNGHLNYQIALLLLATCLWVRMRRGRPLAFAAVLAMSLALFFVHFIPFAVFGLGVVLDAVRWRRWPGVLALVPSGLLSLWYAAGRIGGDVTEGFESVVYGPEGTLELVLYKGYTALKLGPFQHYILPDGHGFLEAVPWLYGLALTVAVVFMLALAAGLLGGAWRVWKARGARRWLIVFGLGVFGLGFLLPAFALNVVNPAERVMAVAFLVMLAVTPLPQRLLRPLAVVAVLFCIYDITYLASQPRLSDASLHADYAALRDTASDAPPPAHADQFRDSYHYVTKQLYGTTRLKYLNHDVYRYAGLYAAIDARDYDLKTFTSGLLVPAPLPVETARDSPGVRLMPARAGR